MAMSADGLLLATSYSNEVIIWDVTTWKERFSLSGHTGQVFSVAFSRDGKRLATGGDDGQVIIWDTATGQNLLSFSVSQPRCAPNVLFNADGTRLITADGCGNVRFWEITADASREVLHRTVHGGRGLNSIKLNPDGTQLAVGDNNNISIWDSNSGFDLFVLPVGWQGQLNGGDFSPDGNLFAAGGSKKVIVWDLSPRGEKSILNANNGARVRDVVFSPDGKWLALATESLDANDVRVWNTNTGTQKSIIQSPGICCSVAFSPDGKRLVTGSFNSPAKVWDATTGKMISVLSGDTAIVFRAVFNADGTSIATSSDDTVKIWDASNYKALKTIHIPKGKFVPDIAFSPNSKLLAIAISSGFTGQVSVWDATTGLLLFHLFADQISPLGLAFSPDGKSLAVGYADNMVRVWDVSSMEGEAQPFLLLRGHSNSVWRVAFSPNGTRLATASSDGTVKLWNMSPGPEQGQEITTLPGHTAEVSAISFSPDGKYLASSSLDGTVRVYFTQLEDLIAYAKTSRNSYIDYRRMSEIFTYEYVSSAVKKRVWMQHLWLAFIWYWQASRCTLFQGRPCFIAIELGKDKKMNRAFFRIFIRLTLGLTITFAETTSAQATDDVLDTSFGSGGIVTTDFIGGDDFANDVDVQEDGKIIVVGTGFNGTENDFALVRYNPEGSLDTTFDIDGRVLTDFNHASDLASAVAFQRDGKIVVAGSANNGADSDFAVARYNSDGSLDTTFDTDGKLTTPIGSNDDYGEDLVLQPDGKIVLTGFSHDNAMSVDNFVVAR